MNRITLTAFKKLTITKLKEQLPLTIISAGKPIAEVTSPKALAPPTEPTPTQKVLFKAPQQADKFPQYPRLQQPTAVWLGEWNGDVMAAANKITEAAKKENKIPQFVVYMIPGRDMGQYSAGGAKGPDAYKTWIDKLSAGLSTKSIIILEPDALVHDASNERVELLKYAVNKLSAHDVYIDAGHPRWHNADETAKRLKLADVHLAKGFSINVSNFVTTELCVQFGNDVSAKVGGSHYIVDVSRNGNKDMPALGAWANPDKARLGQNPTLITGEQLCDAFLWIKAPGESDGWDGIDPSSAGEFRVKLAEDLLKG